MKNSKNLLHNLKSIKTKYLSPPKKKIFSVIYFLFKNNWKTSLNQLQKIIYLIKQTCVST